MERRKDNKGECVKEMCQEGKGGERRGRADERKERRERKSGGDQEGEKKAEGGSGASALFPEGGRRDAVNFCKLF